MSNIDGLAGPIENESTHIQQTKGIKLAPLYQQFTHKIVALLLTITVMVGLTLVLFYQNKIQHSALVDTQLIPLTQELKRIKALQKAEKLIANLRIDANAGNLVELHAELIAINRQLLQQSNLNGQLFQQWLNASQLAEDIVSRIQGSNTRNQQLKLSSIVQLQLMLFSITPIIDNKLASQTLLDNQLKTDQAKGRVTYNSANAYAKLVQQVNYLQQLQSLLADVLLGFEQLNMHTTIASFDALRVKVRQTFSLHKQLKNDDTIKAMIDVNQQFDAFEKIVLTEQSALAKWQGYIRLAQDYQFNLQAQQQKINELLLAPYQYNQVDEKTIVYTLLGKFNIELSNKNIVLILIIALSLSLFVFFYQLWRLREQIKVSAQQSVELIQGALQTEEASLVANCLETQAIINHVQRIAKPQHNDDEFQALSKKAKENQQLLEQKQQKIAQLTKANEQQQLAYKEQTTDQLSDELQRYLSLEQATLSVMQQHQLNCFKQHRSTENDGTNISIQLTSLHQQLAQFHLALDMTLEKSVLQLSDINLVDEIYAILFNKQQEQQKNDNQLFIRCDEQVLSKAKIDFRLFQQFISLFIDISLTQAKKSQLHLHLQLKDKNAGQQLIHFCTTVKSTALDALPELISLLLDSQSRRVAASPLIDIFNILFAKQHGKNVVAQLSDEGYQLSFELPIAVVNTTDNADKVILENTHVLLLSTNTVLVTVVENIVVSAKGKIERLARIDSFKQRLNAKQLNRHKLDLLVVSGEIALHYVDLITQQINDLPLSLQPKLMILQSKELDYQRFGFYSQAEQVLCKDTFLHNIVTLLASNEPSNQLLPCEPFMANKYIATELPVLLGVQSPQQHQNLQRLLHWLGLQVQVVSHEFAQKALWKTGQYSLLITDFPETALLEMTSKPKVNLGVFSLTQGIPDSDNNEYFDHWTIGKLSKESSLTELVEVLSAWLKPMHNVNERERNDEGELPTEALDELVITEVAQVFTENGSNSGNEAVFDFSHYLQHQGTAELALFMLDDYTQDNHQQLDTLIEAIKAKEIAQAQLSVSALALNANILSAQTLQSLCVKWSTLLSGTETSSSVAAVNALLKDTRVVLNEIDEYAETI